MNNPANIDTALRQAKQSWTQLTSALELAREEIKDLEKERSRMNAEMRVCDIAEFFGRDPSTIHRWLNSGKLRSKKMIDVLKLKKQR